MNVRLLFQGTPALIETQARAILAAWSQLTRVPLPARAVKFIGKRKLEPNRAVRYLPLISASVGLLSGASFWGFYYLTQSKGLGVTAAIITTVWITGAFRERGAGHFFDVFSRKKTNTYARAIGATGTIAILLLVLAKFQLLMSMPNHLILTALVTAHAFSSFVTMAFLFTHKPLQPEMHGRYTSFSNVRLNDVDFIMLALLGMLPIALLGHPIFIVLLPTLWIIRALLGVYLTRRPERYTSDALAITQQSTELSFYFGILVLVRFMPGL